jgi:protein-tyrosine phosphatase
MSDRATSPVQRALSWDGFLNVRDLGGLPLAGGGETRYGCVARSEAPHFLSERGWRELHEHGVRTLVDLRCPTEGDYEARNGVRRVGVPLFRQDDPEFLARMRGIRDTGEFYRAIVDFSHRQITRAVTEVADAPAGGVLIHCHAGRDRTGVVAAIVLAVAGVPADSIAADYVASAEALQPRHEEELAAAQTAEEREWLEKIHYVRAESILAALDDIGDPAAYLRAGGATTDQIERVRRRVVV